MKFFYFFFLKINGSFGFLEKYSESKDLWLKVFERFLK
jgi:hypothetical protein